MEDDVEIILIVRTDKVTAKAMEQAISTPSSRAGVFYSDRLEYVKKLSVETFRRV
jgi:hypothetical protein